MTLGERISAGRRAAGISQEVLGERLGVSRQAISKWEGDAAVPELEKLIALSRLFGIPLGALLGIEEEKKEGSADGETLSERELAAVEEIVGRYVSELEKKTPPRRLKRWQLVCLALAVVSLAWAVRGQFERLSARVQKVENNLWGMKSELSSQINSLTWQLADLIEKENSLIADWGYRLEAYDREARTVTLAIWAVPKRAVDGTKAEFAAETEEGGSYVSAASQEASGRYCAWIELPYDLEQELKLSIRLEKDGERQVQLLETIGNLRVQTGLDLWCDWQGSFGYQRKDGSCAFDGSARVQIFPGSEQSAEPVSAQLEILRNGEAVYIEPVELPTGLFKELDRSIELHQAVELADGDALDLALHVVDSLGRDQYMLAVGFDIRADERGWLEADHYDAIQPDYDPVKRK
ncbi:DNA-binding transcriptional regulator, XRE-family HTH domain [Ruminococcaceae bacterium D5]|nr:DNA-binding transcriptional regulator, XRE-family HTH domain [Ruminococcaceae bacterium D5]